MHPSSRRVPALACAIVACAASALAQAPPATGQTRADDTPTVKVGGLLFMDYTYQSSPDVKDADANVVSPSSFNITRAYINVTGNVSRVVSFRITPDAVRETGVGSSLNGSYTLRLKYALAQFNLDDWMRKGSWVRFGLLPTPYLEHWDSIYRYRFQGLNFAESPTAGGALVSADAGAEFHADLPSGYGDVQAGLFNGEGYTTSEINDQKAIQLRGSLRPLPNASVLKGLIVTGFYDGDHYLKNGDKQRAIGEATFQHQYVNAGVTFLSRTDRTRASLDAVTGHGWSLFVTPRTTIGWEALVRYDRFTGNTRFDTQKKTHTVAGVAYWFPHQGTVSAALLLDYDGLTFSDFAVPQPAQRHVAIHGMVGF